MIAASRASVLMAGTAPRLPARAELQILHRVDRAVLIGERELRYQLGRKDDHSLAQADELLDVLADLEQQGLVESELCFRLTAEGRARLAGLNADRGAGR
jgi:hypothetical protein